MSVVNRGVRNAFRNTVRSFSIIFILAISIGLALIMLLSMRAVQSRITSVQSSVGNTITISPAGARGFSGGGNPLTSANVATITSTAHVTAVTPSIEDRLSTTGSTTSNFPGGGSGGTTNLTSPINAGRLGRRFGGGGGQGGFGGAGSSFSLPITVTGTTNPTSTMVAGTSKLTITSGSTINGNGSADVALVGKSLASKNNLSIGSTFTAYGQTISVSGIYDTGNTFSNGGIIMPLATVQSLSGQSGDVTSILVQVDTLGNVSGVVSALQSELGSAADVVSSQDATNTTLSSLQSIKTISLYSLIGALVAGAVIIFLTMLMIVRERRREIGVLKAIGSSNGGIVGQFMVEALTLTVVGAVVGTVLGVLLSNPVLGFLVSSNTTTSSAAAAGFGSRSGGGGGFGHAASLGGGVFRAGRNTINTLHTVVSFDILLYGLGVAVVVALLGSAIPAWLIAKVRPAEVMRAE